MQKEDLSLYSETDKYPFFFHGQHCHFFNYLNKDVEEIYHYTSLETMSKILETSSLRFTNINDLNDECEFTYLFMVLHSRIRLYRYKYSKEFCDNLLVVCSKYCNDEFYYIGDIIKKDIERNYYVASFSTDNDNLPLWTLYTKEKNFIGCNFGININDIDIKPIKGPVWGGKVIYSHEEQVRILDELVATWYNYYEKISLDEYFAGDIHDALYKYALFFKHPAFEHEKEYRYIYDPFSNDGIQMLNNRLYIDIKCNIRDSIKQVELSPTLREDIHIENIKKLFKKYNAKTTIFEISSIPFRI